MGLFICLGGILVGERIPTGLLEGVMGGVESSPPRNIIFGWLQQMGGWLVDILGCRLTGFVVSHLSVSGWEVCPSKGLPTSRHLWMSANKICYFVNDGIFMGGMSLQGTTDWEVSHSDVLMDECIGVTGGWGP